MPELERRKMELAQKRGMQNTLNHDEIASHSRRYNEMRREQSLRREKAKNQRMMDTNLNEMANHYASKFTHEILNREQVEREEREKQA
jgi:hypothetical protein